jgi:hypothetical protein
VFVKGFLKYFLLFARTSRTIRTTHTSGAVAIVGCRGVKVGVVTFSGGVEAVYIARAVRRIGVTIGGVAVQHRDTFFLLIRDVIPGQECFSFVLS